MTCVSGIGRIVTFVESTHRLIEIVACVVGSSIICVDLLIQRFPGKRNFRIQDSNGFLASSLSLSFGVMVGTILVQGSYQQHN